MYYFRYMGTMLSNSQLELHVEYYNSVQKALRMVLLFDDFNPFESFGFPDEKEVFLEAAQDVYTVLLQKAIEIEIASGSIYPDVDGIDITIQEDYILDFARPEGIYNPLWGDSDAWIYGKIVLHYRHKDTTEPQEPPPPSDPKDYEAKDFYNGVMYVPDPSTITTGDQWNPILQDTYYVYNGDPYTRKLELHPECLGLLLAQTRATLEAYDPLVELWEERIFINEFWGVGLSEGEALGTDFQIWGRTWRTESDADYSDLVAAWKQGIPLFPTGKQPANRAGWWYDNWDDKPASLSYNYTGGTEHSLNIRGKPIPDEWDYIFIPGIAGGGIFSPIAATLLGQFLPALRFMDTVRLPGGGE